MRIVAETRNVTSKGQVTIPKEFRKRLNINPSDKVKFELKEIEGELCLTLSKPSAFSYLLKELQKEAEKKIASPNIFPT